MNNSDNNYRNDFTATGYLVNPKRTKMLLIFHNKLMKWLPAGGHIEPNELPDECAVREVLEETGIKAKIVNMNDINIGFISRNDIQLASPFCILYELIPASKKDIEHKHVDFIYIMEAAEKNLNPKLEEVKEAKWLTLDEILAYDSFPAVKQIAKMVLK